MNLPTACHITTYSVFLWITGIVLIKIQRIIPYYLSTTIQLTLVPRKLVLAVSTCHQKGVFRISFYLCFKIVWSWQHKLSVLHHVQLWTFHCSRLFWQDALLLFLLAACISYEPSNGFLPQQQYLLTLLWSSPAAHQHCQNYTAR